MEQPTLTASAIIDFAERLEEFSLGFYARLADRFPEHKAMFSRFAEESRKNKVHIVRTYQETITDALEAGFSFKGLDLSRYTVDIALPEEVGLGKALTLATALEETAGAFYREVAKRSKSLLATIPMAFKQAGKRRSSRKSQLTSLMEKA